MTVALPRSGARGSARVRGRVRRMLRHLAVDARSAGEALTARRDDGLSRARVALPYFHAVPHDREWALRELLLRLHETHTFIGYSEAMERIRRGDIDRPYVAFSFDDGFASNLRAARILEEFGASACFFVPAGFVGTSSVAEARDFYGFSQGVDEPAMSWADLETLVAAGHEIGNHTANHRVLSWIPEAELEDEIGSGAETLRSRLGDVRHFAWPRGTFDHFSEAAARMVFRTGHESCASAVRGAHVAAAGEVREELCVRRDHLMVEWPVRHSLHFLARSGRLASPVDNSWPDDWQVPA